MKRSECTSKTLESIGFETLPTLADEYITPLKDVAYYLREEGFDCKVELDTTKEYEEVKMDWSTSYYEADKVVYYHFEYLYIRPHGTSKWNKVARRKVETYHYSINKNRD